MTLHHHRGGWNEPVPLHLRDEAPDPRAELDALGIELNGRAELTGSALRVVELVGFDVSLKIFERVAERTAAAACGRQRRA